MMRFKFPMLLVMAAGLVVNGCSKDSEDNNPTDNTFNLFSVDDDIELGKSVDEEIRSNPTEYPVLDESQYPDAYAHLRRIRDNVLNSGEVFYKDRFEWKVGIIHDDDVLNAFAAPGGYIFVYTGIIKFLDSEYELAGVMGHEIAHADRRHSTDMLTGSNLRQAALDILLGDSSQVAELAGGLINLSFSRKHEREADEYSVIYLCPTEYKADGAAAFFEKIGSQPVPEFLSTHPNPTDRVESIREKHVELGCTATGTFDQRYQEFKNSLPQ